MQNQVNANPERPHPVSNPVTVAAPFIFTSGEVVNLTSLVSSANTKTTSAQFSNSTTSVLATLAALAEASAPVSNSNRATGRTEETIIEDEEEAENLPLTKKPRIEEMTDSVEESKEGSERELLQHQLQEANRRAQEYRHQLLKKEQEAEQYRLKLEAMARQQPNGVDFTMVEEVADVDALVVTEGEVEERETKVTGSAGTKEPPHTGVSVETVSS
ncbi:PREDICTED: GA-binding protein subunit beta-2 [Propithecus coquereli]|uniref:GA-binding protein subunit beta-2 n=1 Tax=Propithecus coquereli TaxID=379532 RepID=UPI00063EFEBF|nr:PREDICTED: GA-binding protein subunit beta-2 [Propithecus coquereli]